MPERIPRESREYLPVAVEGDQALTGLPVEMQVLPYGVRPGEDEWQQAAWDVDDDGQTIAKILIGPGTGFDFSGAPGTYIPWVRVTTDDEAPVIEGQPLDIT
ncbi:hypothetical protein JOL79_11365 [Microbispora sp. RL4-1S]|uniref:Uncharacterized protein n=1 Tax=Microbispora oryzae TaxID=2806554 RepID=A0A941AIZ5_9ACTN|nr:hypothetical protein [Microbispora oryzae]MBP2704412.1 hypothetical protein [Microbispora oryzae]